MQNNNLSISQDMNRIFDLKGESTNVIADFIQPTILINRFNNIVRRNSAINTTSASIYQTPIDKDFYLTSVFLSIIKDINATSVGSNISVVIEGVTVQLLSIPGLTLTPQTMGISYTFNLPIKIDRNTSISLNNTTNVANITANGGIIGYTVETTK